MIERPNDGTDDAIWIYRLQHLENDGYGAFEISTVSAKIGKGQPVPITVRQVSGSKELKSVTIRIN